jgi:hypothetical protein
LIFGLLSAAARFVRGDLGRGHLFGRLLDDRAGVLGVDLGGALERTALVDRLLRALELCLELARRLARLRRTVLLARASRLLELAAATLSPLRFARAVFFRRTGRFIAYAAATLLPLKLRRLIHFLVRSEALGRSDLGVRLAVATTNPVGRRTSAGFLVRAARDTEIRI